MSAPEPRELITRPDPPPALKHLRRRLADRQDFRDGLLAGIAGAPQTPGGAQPLGANLDVAGDPEIVLVAELWSRVADSVAAYTELTAGEHYVGTAADWTDLRRTIDLLGYRPTQRAAAHGWIRVETETGTNPLVPAGTRVQAPGTPQRPAQTFEVTADTQLRDEWANLTVTGVPTPAPPPGRALRMLTDPGFASGDVVALVAERLSGGTAMPKTWGSAYLNWLGWLNGVSTVLQSRLSLRGVVRVKKVTRDCGAYLVTTDRELGELLADVAGTTYAAYRVRATLTLAQRMQPVIYFKKGLLETNMPTVVSSLAVSTPSSSTPSSSTPSAGLQSASTAMSADLMDALAKVSYAYSGESDPVNAYQLLVDDAQAATPGMSVLICDSSRAVINKVKSVGVLNWSVAPGTKRQVGRIELVNALPASLRHESIQIRLVDQRVVAQHYELPTLEPGQTRLRIHPRPTQVPNRIAVATTSGWELATCSADAVDTDYDTGGRLLVLDSGLVGKAAGAPATANLVAIRHGASLSEQVNVRGGVAIIPGPVTADIDSSGRVTSSLAVRVAGVAFDEVSSLYGRDPGEPVYTTRLAADGRLVLQFVSSAPRNDVSAAWRDGGGLAGELDGALIDTLLSSVRGVRRVAGVGHTTGAADQEDALRMRRAAPARVRALDRAVSLTDLADLALTVPGTSHAVAWRGAGPPKCPCAGVGVHLAFLRHSATGVRAPAPAELTSMAGFLDSRRDTTVGLCVCPGMSSVLEADLGVVTDPRRDPAAVRQRVVEALLDPQGPLAPGPRKLGLPLDASDVIAIAQAIAGVVGIVNLTLTHGLGAPSPAEIGIGRTPAARHELLSLGEVTVS